MTRNRRAELIGTGQSWKGLGGSAVHHKRSSYTSTTRETQVSLVFFGLEKDAGQQAINPRMVQIHITIKLVK